VLFWYLCSVLCRVGQDHRRAGSSRLVVAGLTGAARRHAGWGQLTEPETTAGAAGLREILAGRDDGPWPLAEVAAILTGFSEGAPGQAKAKAAAELYISGSCSSS
jgi:hypothetical protein